MSLTYESELLNIFLTSVVERLSLSQSEPEGSNIFLTSVVARLGLTQISENKSIFDIYMSQTCPFLSQTGPYIIEV